jgi:KDO2-lipid IV(A) lauroyltransferase
MSSRKNTLVSRIGGYAFSKFQPAFQKRDVVGAERLGEKLAVLWYRVDKKHRERAMKNILLAFPDKSEEEGRALALETFRHFGRSMGDFLRSPARSNEEVLASVESANFDTYLKAKAMDKGIIAVSGHMGNFERLAHWYQAKGETVKGVARDANDEFLQAQVAKIRDSTGMVVLSRGSSARELLRCLKNKETIGLLPDQNADECFVPFFGKPCGTTLGPAVIHLRTGSPLVPAYCVRTGPGKYKVEFSDPMVYSRETTPPEQIMADINLNLENMARRYPEQYLWLHDRWKSARRAGLL